MYPRSRNGPALWRTYLPLVSEWSSTGSLLTRHSVILAAIRDSTCHSSCSRAATAASAQTTASHRSQAHCAFRGGGPLVASALRSPQSSRQCLPQQQQRSIAELPQQLERATTASTDLKRTVLFAHQTTVHKRTVLSAVFSPDSACEHTASGDNTAKIWNSGRIDKCVAC